MSADLVSFGVAVSDLASYFASALVSGLASDSALTVFRRAEATVFRRCLIQLESHAKRSGQGRTRPSSPTAASSARAAAGTSDGGAARKPRRGPRED